MLCLLLAIALCLPAAAQEEATSSAASITVTVADPEEWIDRDTALRLELDRAPEVEEGRIAVLLGVTDITELFEARDAALVYRPELLPLPAGRSELKVYLVGPAGAWTELATLPIAVRRAAGIEELQGDFALNLQGTSQFDSGGEPQAPETFDRGGWTFDLGGGASRGGWNARANLSTIGTTEQVEALRFAERGENADRFDLASFLVRVERDLTFFELGHVSYGQHRHLISGFSARGLSFAIDLGRGGTILGGAMSGRSLVGFDRFIGFDDSDNRVLTVGYGVELIAKRPGALRLDLDFLDGTRTQFSGFNQGEVGDREENEGWGVRIGTSTPNQRLSLRAGFARSEFVNPEDPFLSQGVDLVPVLPEERDALYADLDIALVQGRQLAENWPFSLNLGVRHERVDPQYRSVGAYVQSDIEQTSSDLSATLGAIAAQVGHQRSEDNIDDIPSILKTKTRRSNANVAVPLPMLFGAEPRPWLPSLTLGYDRTHQFATGQPIDSGFNATNHLPDQVNVNHLASLDWQGNRWQFGYSFNASDQDNRQPGREDADFENVSHGLRLSLAPHQKLDLGLEYSRDRAESLDVGRTDENERVGFNFLWRPIQRFSLSGNHSLTETTDDPRTMRVEATVSNAEAAYRFDWRPQAKHGGSAQLYLRWANQEIDSADTVFDTSFFQDEWTLTAGFNLSLR
ncbi:MAG: hypothetical protein DWQ36_03345 [Acidobacteria bacterium]|nr:MAG: hypothetical protein DWQ30_23055 [Acidobacteriota bacterium]REK10733.1 MAG: hypothetical protein DWQ36_03345 [Acidobacteriota bacterium]